MAAAALGAGPDVLLADLNLLGLLFESLVVRDLRFSPGRSEGGSTTTGTPCGSRPTP